MRSFSRVFCSAARAAAVFRRPLTRRPRAAEIVGTLKAQRAHVPRENPKISSPSRISAATAGERGSEIAGDPRRERPLVTRDEREP
jgi:hypothetical protein